MINENMQTAYYKLLKMKAPIYIKEIYKKKTVHQNWGINVIFHWEKSVSQVELCVKINEQSEKGYPYSKSQSAKFSYPFAQSKT